MSSSSSSYLSTGQPRYVVLAQSLMEDITRGKYPVGSLLPTEAELAKTFNVSRHTVRESLRKLSEFGLIVRIQGVGTRVKSSEVSFKYVQVDDEIEDLHRFSRNLKLVIDSYDVASISNQNFSEHLLHGERENWINIKGRRYADFSASPLAITDIFIPAIYRNVIASIGGESPPVYSLIESKFQIKVVEVEQEIKSVCLSDGDAVKLDCPAGSPGMVVVRKYYLSDGELVEVAVSTYNGNKFSYSSRFRLKAFAS